nr:PREDICTED: uncharacterized protein LOC107078776 [Lepisosteus oculatus]
MHFHQRTTWTLGTTRQDMFAALLLFVLLSLCPPLCQAFPRCCRTRQCHCRLLDLLMGPGNHAAGILTLGRRSAGTIDFYTPPTLPSSAHKTNVANPHERHAGVPLAGRVYTRQTPFFTENPLSLRASGHHSSILIKPNGNHGLLTSKVLDDRLLKNPRSYQGIFVTKNDKTSLTTTLIKDPSLLWQLAHDSLSRDHAAKLQVPHLRILIVRQHHAKNRGTESKAGGTMLTVSSLSRCLNVGLGRVRQREAGAWDLALRRQGVTGPVFLKA